MVFLMGQIFPDNPNEVYADLPPGHIRTDDPLGIERSLAITSHLPPNSAKVIAACDPIKSKRQGHLVAARAQLDAHRDEIVAFKCYLGFMGHPCDAGYEPYYKLAQEYDIPVIFHTGFLPSTLALFSDCHPLEIDKVAVRHQHMKIVIAHAGNPFFMEAVAVAGKNNNVWLDLSSLQCEEEARAILMESELPAAMPNFAVAVFREAITALNRYDRLLFGTDNICSPKTYRRFMERLIPEEHHSKVFRENAEKLFKVDVPEVVPGYGRYGE